MFYRENVFRTGKWIIIGLVLIALSNPALARKKDDEKATGAIDAATFEILTKAQELTEGGKYNEAVQTLDKLKGNTKMNSYAKSQMWNFYAYIYANQENYKSAIGAYKKLLAEPDAPPGLKQTAKYTIAQLYFQLEDYKSVISFMEEWLREIGKPTPTAHIMLAQAYYQEKNYDPALKHLDRAIALEKKEGKPIKENWLRTKAAIYFEKNDVKNTLKTYEELLARFPKVSYLRQIAGLNGELGNDRKRLTTYDALYLDDQLQNESEVLNLGYMYLGQDIPYKAGKIIETGMSKGQIKSSPKNTETLANAWAQANEHRKAIPALEKAASLSDKGILWARLAGVHFDAGDFDKAAAAAKKADLKGGLRNRSGNQMLMGMALFNVKKFEGALQAFRQAKQTKRAFSDARKWESYTLRELEILKALEESKFKLAEKTEEALRADENNVEAIGGNLLREQQAQRADLEQEEAETAE
ncbi:MAG: tetratricopeptide repeat protein [Pseudomonadota bacterium]